MKKVKKTSHMRHTMLRLLSVSMIMMGQSAHGGAVTIQNGTAHKAVVTVRYVAKTETSCRTDARLIEPGERVALAGGMCAVDSISAVIHKLQDPQPEIGVLHTQAMQASGYKGPYLADGTWIIGGPIARRTKEEYFVTRRVQ